MKFLARIFNRTHLFKRKEINLTNLVSIHLSSKPSADECATALRLMFIVAGADVFKSAVEALPNIPGMGDAVVSIEAAGFGATEDDSTSVPDPNAPATDKLGAAWDANIHSSSKKMNADGTWKKRKGGPASPVAAAPVVSAVPQAPVPVPPVAAAPMPPAVPPAPSGLPTDFASFMRAAGSFLPGNKITMGEINEICQSLGYDSPMALKGAPNAAELFPIAFEMVKDKAASK